MMQKPVRLALRENYVRTLPTRKLSVSAAAVAALLCLGAATISHGADVADNAAENQGPLADIIVTATRHDESLSKVPISVTAVTQEAMDIKGIKDISDIARFTPGVTVDTSGTNNIAIRGISSSGGAGTTGIYIDDTPIQIRALAFNPDDALPKSFDIDRVEVLRGPQGTLFGAGSEGGTVRYITTQPSLTKTSFYSRDEVSYTEGGAPSYEAGVAGGMPLIDGKLGARLTIWYRRDGGYIDHIDPTSLQTIEKNANYEQTFLARLSTLWQVSDSWSVQPSIYYQDRFRNEFNDYWPLYSNPSNNRFVSADPDTRTDPDRFYLASFKVEGDIGIAKLISNTSFYHRIEETGYSGTLYNLGFYQSGVFINGDGSPASSTYPLLDGSGVHLPPGLTNYRSPASIDNTQRNFAQEIRLQSNDPSAKLQWTTGLFASVNRQSYTEQIHDPMLNALSVGLTGATYDNWFGYTDNAGNYIPTLFDPHYPQDSYFLHTRAKDQQIAAFGEGTYSFTDQFKLTLGARMSWTQFSNDSLTGGPQLFYINTAVDSSEKEKSFTPKLSFSYQMDPNNLFYFTYAKGFRPGGANNPVPYPACAEDFSNFGITGSPATFGSDSVHSFEVGAKNNFDNRVKIASSVYYIRWNHIQQTVVPPICQISFIDNLGTAIAKGVDLQAEVAITDNFTAEFSTGYTDARYTASGGFANPDPTAPPNQPIVERGDAISGQSGQPNAPFTASLGLEYKFNVFNVPSFVRFDDEYESRNHYNSPSQDINTAQFDDANYHLSATNFASARAGASFGTLQIAAFCDNLMDTHTVTNYEWTIDPGDGNSRLERQFAFRPRTFGVTFTYRH
ncbi:MAG TPA: TonB-dependent receptor [Steroidobacteraceae bacterium]